MAQLQVTLQVRRRFFFWPALIIIVILGRLRILRDQQKAGKWLADHAMRLEASNR